MQKNVVLFSVVSLLIGLIIGFFAANSLNRNALSQQPVAPSQTGTPFANQPPNAPGQTDGGIAEVQEKLEKAAKEPDNFAAQMNAGDLYAQIGRYDKAFEFYERGVKLDPNNFQANVQLANSYFDGKQYENAEKYYTKALEINPKDVNARTDLGTTFVERQNPNYERAIKEFQTVLEINPKHEPTLYNLAVAYNRMNDAENARKILSQMEQINSSSPLVERLRKVLSTK